MIVLMKWYFFGWGMVRFGKIVGNIVEDYVVVCDFVYVYFFWWVVVNDGGEIESKEINDGYDY